VTRPNGPTSICDTCWWLERTLKHESCASVAELNTRQTRAEYHRARIADILRRSGVDDAEQLIASLSAL